MMMTTTTTTTTKMTKRVQSTVLAILAVTYSSAASPNPVNILQRRKPILEDSDTVTLDGKAPLDAILLVGAGLGAALLCLILAIYKVSTPNHSGSRMIREERARAKTELRLKGGGGPAPASPSPTRMIGEKKRHNSATTDNISFDSHTKLMHNPHRHPSDSPKIASQQNKKPSRASRGYSSYSKSEVSTMTRGYSLEPTLSQLAVPTLTTNYKDNASSQSLSNQSLSSGSASTSSPPVPWRPQYQERSQSYASNHSRRISTTVGRGIDLHRNRSKKSASRKIHVNPQAVDPTYYSNTATYRTSPRSSAAEINDPLAGLELKRYTTDPSDSREGSRRNSTMNALDFFNHGNARGNYADSASESNSHEYTGLTSTTAASPPQRSRANHHAYYDAEQDLGTPGGQQHHPQDSSLLEYGGQGDGHRAGGSSSRGSWSIWGAKF